MIARAVPPTLRCLSALLAVACSLAGAQQPPETEVLLDKVQRFEERGGRLASLHGIRQSLFSEYVSQGTTTLFQIDELMELQQRDYVEYHSVHGDGYAVRLPEGGYNFFADKLTDFPTAEVQRSLGWQHLLSLVVVPH